MKNNIIINHHILKWRNVFRNCQSSNEYSLLH